MFKARNIWFRCPACEKRLVVDAAAGGMRADCPECGRTIPIPVRSTIYPNWVKTAALATGQFLLVAMLVGAGWVWMTTHRQPSTEPAETDPSSTVQSSTPPSGSETPVSTPGETNVTAKAIDQQLLDDHLALQQRYNKMVQWMIDNYRGKYPLPQHLVGRLRIAPLGEDGALNPELVEILRLSDDEKAQVEDIFTYIRASLTEAELDRALITEQSEDQITITVPTFADVGGSLREDLFMTLETTLGGPRFDRMVDISGEQLREQFNYFGEASRTLTFQVIYPTGNEHPPYVLVKDGWVIPEGESVRLTKVTETAITRLPETYRNYQPFLPEGVSRYAAP